ncbi:hypothetical protein K402DRAFT_467872 [Aulographum hederae CBS 113979]|uniref:Uncharacterized protein n=1 Tax=Aulographum hederae CBS 113979 TaxID=1176131 RepID=A0A6G1GJU4_9PEZI|nr:hypothetical protein K402DRAFT_467872 [Aulographum hederae CBS 113979]
MADLQEWDKSSQLYLFTSLTAGSSHIITATSRIETILKANRLPFTYVDTATDESAKKLFQRRARGKKLPLLVKEGYIIGDLDEIEEANEFGELKEMVGPLPPPAATSITTAPAKAPVKSSAKPTTSTSASPVSSSTASAPETAKKENQNPISLTMRQLGSEVAAKAKDMKTSGVRGAVPAPISKLVAKEEPKPQVAAPDTTIDPKPTSESASEPTTTSSEEEKTAESQSTTQPTPVSSVPDKPTEPESKPSPAELTTSLADTKLDDAAPMTSSRVLSADEGTVKDVEQTEAIPEDPVKEETEAVNTPKTKPAAEDAAPVQDAPLEAVESANDGKPTTGTEPKPSKDINPTAATASNSSWTSTTHDSFDDDDITDEEEGAGEGNTSTLSHISAWGPPRVASKGPTGKLSPEETDTADEPETAEEESSSPSDGDEKPDTDTDANKPSSTQQNPAPAAEASAASSARQAVAEEDTTAANNSAKVESAVTRQEATATEKETSAEKDENDKEELQEQRKTHAKDMGVEAGKLEEIVARTTDVREAKDRDASRDVEEAEAAGKGEKAVG